MTDRLGPPSQFRLNFEQQQKRAKDLLKAARAGEAAALARFKSPPKLAEAQRLIAAELRFDSWAAMKQHIAAMTRAREAIETPSADAPALDAELQERCICAAAATSKGPCRGPACAASSTSTATRT